MIFHPTSIHGAWMVEPEPRQDGRGSFTRAFCLREFAGQGLGFEVVQANLAKTVNAGVIRGLHYQEPPEEDQKLVRCVAGAIHDVIIDTRPSSPTYLAMHQVRLDDDNGWAIFVPGGVAHGYQALASQTSVMYLTDRYYRPGLERGVRWDDPRLAADWPLEPRDMAERDRNWPWLTVNGE